MDSNQQLVLELCRFMDYDQTEVEKILENGVDLPEILGQLLYHRMGGVAYKTLKSSSILPKLNREFRSVLSSIYISNCIKTESFFAAMADLSELLETAEFPYAFLKGAYLASLYPKGLRTSNDFDILVDQKDITALEILLRQGGFKQGYLQQDDFREATRQEIIFKRINIGETVPFIKEVNLPYMKHIEVDINFSLDFKAVQETPIVASLLKKAQSIILTDKKSLYTLSPCDFLIHLCAHLYKEASVYNWVQRGRDLSLYKFCDIYLYIHDFFTDQFAKELAQSIRQYEMQKECFYALYYSRLLFSMKNDVLDWLLEAIKPKDFDYMNQIYDPVKNETYSYDMEYIDWLFCCDRIHHLHGKDRVPA